MLTRISIRDFQSLEHVDLALGRFTVVVGASNSGKSALLRAIRALCLNVSSPQVRHGAKALTVEAEVDGRKIAIARGPRRSEYQLEAEVYPKAGTTVPDPVAALLRMAPDEANFAFQFDRPYLLSDSASQVAQTIGELTNVNVVYDAVREANRRRLEVGHKLKVRKVDVDRLEDQATEYVDMPERKQVLARIRDSRDRLVEADLQVTRLEGLLAIVKAASTVLDQMQELAPLPDLDLVPLERAALEALQLERLIIEARRASTDASLAEREAADAEAARLVYEEHIHDLLEDAGVCPLCGQPIKETASVGD